VQLAQPSRPVVCVVGEGSAQYALSALWTAAAYSVPVAFLVVRNSEYAILKWFAEMEGVSGAPGLDLPGLDCARLASAYGVEARGVEAGELGGALERAIEADAPQLVEIDVAPGMALA
jgi:benzoylformate decarboxylase